MKYLVFIIFSLLSFGANSKPLGLKNAYFLFPIIEGDNKTNNFQDTPVEPQSILDDLEEAKQVVDKVKVSEDGENFTISIPIKSENGEYEVVDIVYTEDEDTRTINIPGQGDVSVIIDENGDYSLELTPEQIKESNNISCKVDSSGKSACTISPFVSMIGSKVLKSDELTVDYKGSGNLVIMNGIAKNLILVDENSQTGFNKSTVEGGDTSIGLSFSRKGESNSGDNVSSLLNPFNNNASNILNSPEQFQNSDNFQITLNTSKLVKEVTNPNDPNDKKTQFKVLDNKGVTTSLRFSDGDTTNINMNATINGGFFYNSDPFSKDSTIVESSSPVSLNFSSTTADKGTNTSLSVLMSDTDLSGNQSTLQISDNERNQNISAFGNTGIQLKQNDKDDVAFEIFSGRITSEQTSESGKKAFFDIEGVKVEGLKVADKLNLGVTGDTLNYVTQKNGVPQSSLYLGNGIQYLLEEDNDLKKQQARVGVAYYNNGKTNINLSGDVFLEKTDFKNENSAFEIDGKKVKSRAFASGSSGSVDNGEYVGTLRDSFSYQEIDFFDGSSQKQYIGSNGGIDSSKYKINFSDGIVIKTEEDSKGEMVKTSLQATSLTGNEKDSDRVFSVLGSSTSVEQLGKTSTNKDILQIDHSSEQVQLKDSDSKLRVDGALASGVDADKIKYGDISFKEGNYVKVKNENEKESVKVTGFSSSFYIDESDEENNIKNVSAEILGVSAKAVDYSIDILAKNANGEEEKFKIILMEEGPAKSYKIFSEDGSLVHTKGETKDHKIPDAVFESITYFESDEFKEYSAVKLKGSVEEIGKEDPKLYDFNVARTHGYESLDGKFKQYNIEDGEVNEFDLSKSQNTFLGASNINITEDNILGKKQLEVVNGNASQVNPNEETKLNGLNFNGIDENNIKYGTITFDSASNKRNLLSTGTFGEEVQFVDLSAAFYIDKTDPDNEVKEVSAKIGEIQSDSKDMKLRLLAKNENGEQEKLSVFFQQNGEAKTYQVYAEDGSLIYVSTDDKNGQLSDATFKGIELFESPEFEQALIWEMEGNIKTLTSEDDELVDFSLATGNILRNKITGAEEASFTNIKYNSDDKISDEVNSLSTDSVLYKNNGKTEKVLAVTGLNGSQIKGKDSLLGADINLNAVKNESILSGSLSMDKLESIKGLNSDSTFDEKITLLGVDAVFYIDDSDSKNPYKNAFVEIDDLKVVGADYSIEMFVLDENGEKQKFTVFFLEDGANKTYKIYAADGSFVHAKGMEKGEDLPDVLFKSLEYFESDKFKQAVGYEVKGELKTVDEKDDKVERFNFARVSGIEFLDGSYKNYLVNKGLVEIEDLKAKKNSSFQFETGAYTETKSFDDSNSLVLKELVGEFTDGVVKQISFNEKGDKKNEILLNVEHLISKETEDKDGSKVKIVQATNTDLLLIDFEDMQEFNAKAGKATLYEDDFVTSINIEDLETFSFKDLESGTTANAKAKNIVRIVNRDKNGKELSSYLLIDQAALDVSDESNGLKAEIKVGVLEYLQDRLSGKNIILKADIQGKIVLDKSSIGAEVSFDVQANNITYSSEKFKSVDGSVIKNSIHVDAHGAQGRIDKVQLSAGPDFLKEALHLEAKGSREGGRSIRLSYEQDKKKGKYYLKGEFKDGESLEVKLFPFKWKAEKTKDGDGVAFSQIITPKGQNMMNHLDIVSEVVATQELTDWLKISPGGVITARTGTLGGFAVELLYKDSENLKFQNDPGFDGMAQEAKSIGASIVKVNDKGDESAVGVLFSGDSEIDVQTTEGDFSILGIKQKDHARLPGTVNLFFKKKYADGDGFYTGVFYSVPSALIDEDMLDKNAEFYEGGRTSGKAGASLAYFKKLSPHSQLKFGAGVNNDFKDPAFCLTYTNNKINPIEDLANGVLNVVNGMPFSRKINRGYVGKRQTASQKTEIKTLEDDIDALQIRYDGVRLLEKVNRGLIEADKFFKSGSVYSEDSKKLLNESIADLENFSSHEVDFGSVKKIKKIVAKMKEARILFNPKMSKADKVRWKAIDLRESMNELVKSYDSKDSIDIYIDYLDKYRKLQSLGVNPKLIKK